MRTALTLILISTGLVACSQQNWYQGAQAAQTAQCMKEPLSEYRDCKQQSGEASYDDYKKSQKPLKTEQ